MTRNYVILLLLCFFLVAKAQESVVFNNQAPKHEVRAVWLATIGGIDWPHSYSQSERSAEKQKKELTSILDRLQAAQINTVLIQTRIRGTMIYPSQYEPWDGCLSGFPGTTPGYDALQFAIDECHKRGMELHAWVVTIPVGKWDALGCKSLRKKYPNLIRKIGSDGFMNPEKEQTGDYLASICREIAHNYNVDGIHLDYIRYPETWKIKVNRDYGRECITRIVRKIHDAVKQEKPWIKMSCAPIGKYDDLSRYWSHGWNANTTVCQDAQGWLKEGLMDELFPMMYFRNEQFFPFAIDWKERDYGKIVVPGLGIYFLDPKEGKWKIGDVTSEMYHLRNIGLGHAFYRNKFLLDNKQGIYDFTVNDFNLYPSLVPAMTWASQKTPKQPQDMKVESKEGYQIVTWSNPTTYTDGTAISTPYIYNNVYASRTYPVDVNDARNLVKARFLGNSISLKPGNDDSPLYFAVTSMDGYGTESAASEEIKPQDNSQDHRFGKARMLFCDGETVKMPENEKNLESELLTVETLEGAPVLTRKYDGNRLSITTLSDGMYHLKSINKKGISHSIGTFVKKKV